MGEVQLALPQGVCNQDVGCLALQRAPVAWLSVSGKDYNHGVPLAI